MATPHLTKNSVMVNNKYPLNAINNSHLLIVRQTTNYSNVTMVIPPSEEKFVTCAAWGESSTYDNNRVNVIAPDANTIANNLNTKVQSLTKNDWTSGHKSIFGYWARSGCPARVYNNPSTMTSTIQQKYLEFGVTRNALKFDLKGIPLGMFSSVSAKLRFRNPSWTFVDPWGTVVGFNRSHYNTSDMLYKFQTSIGVPSDLDTNYNYCRFCNDFANQGKVSSSGEVLGSAAYDPYNIVSYSNWWNKAKILIYYNGVYDGYTNEHTLDATALAQLKTAVGQNRYVWMIIGPRIINGIADPSLGIYGMDPGTRTCVYTSNVELVLTVTGNKYNY